MKRKITVGHIIIVVILILLACICFYPVWYTLVCSFSSRVYVENGDVWLIPHGFNLISYQKILADSDFFSSFVVSVKRVIAGCLLNMLLLVITAYPLSLPEKNFQGVSL